MTALGLRPRSKRSHRTYRVKNLAMLFQPFSMISRFLLIIFISGALSATLIPSWFRTRRENRQLKVQLEAIVNQSKQLQQEVKLAKYEAYQWKKQVESSQSQLHQTSRALADSIHRIHVLEHEAREKDAKLVKKTEVIDSLSASVIHYAYMVDSLLKNLTLVRHYARKLYIKLVRLIERIKLLEKRPSREGQLIQIIIGLSLIVLFLTLVIALQFRQVNWLRRPNTMPPSPKRDTKDARDSLETQLN